jgi:signal transduction histidine kinase
MKDLQNPEQNIWKGIGSLFRRPDFEDIDQREKGTILYVSSLSLIILAMLLVIFGLLFHWPVTVKIAILNIFINLLVLILIRVERMPLAAILHLLYLVFAILMLSWQDEGLHELSAYAYPMVIILASYLLEYRLFILVTGLVMTSGFIIGLPQSNPRLLYPGTFNQNPAMVEVIIFNLLMLVIAIVSYLLSRYLKRTRATAIQQSLELAEKNQLLQDFQANLEEIIEQRTEALLATQNKLIETEKLALLGQLTATVAHEIRNPLGTIRTSFFLVNERLDSDRAKLNLERPLSFIDKNIQRIDRIIEELLDFTRKRNLIPKPTDLNNWLKHLLDEYSANHSILLQSIFKAENPVYLDTGHFRRAIINLLDNARQSIENAQNENGLIQIETASDNDIVQIKIIDNGEGIAPEIANKIKSPLFSTRNFGVGLGLPIAIDIIQEHDGTLDIDNHPQGGAIIHITLPTADINKSNSQAKS